MEAAPANASRQGTGIRRGTLFQIKANGLKDVDGKYHELPPALYHGVLGANPAGEVAAKFEIPIHPGRYDAVSVIAWSGTEPPGACGFDEGGHTMSSASTARWSTSPGWVRNIASPVRGCVPLLLPRERESAETSRMSFAVLI
jgi:hypothetical protein